ncbi:MAG TPA: LytR C-terminal domain-containing protein [Dermatophilaceae bacterium]|nr:LytR C-terminal domain-containing protein [Dermatophilaceae bacterium]
MRDRESGRTALADRDGGTDPGSGPRADPAADREGGTDPASGPRPDPAADREGGTDPGSGPRPDPAADPEAGTDPGSGPCPDPAADYDVEPAHRVRHAVVLVLALGLVAAALVYVGPSLGDVLSAAFAAKSEPPACIPVRVAAPAPGSFVVNVYNGSDRAGQGRLVAKDLQLRDFKVGAVANDPRLAVINESAHIRHGPTGLPQALVLAQQVAGATLVNDYRSGTSVDFVVGVGFTALLPAAPKPPPARGSFVVNVYNTTFRTGLASATAKQLAARGFRTGKSANDPLKSMIAGVGELRYGDRGERQAQLIGKHLPGLASRNDGRPGTSVDLVLGNGYTALLPAASVAPEPVPAKATPPMVTLSGC